MGWRFLALLALSPLATLLAHMALSRILRSWPRQLLALAAAPVGGVAVALLAWPWIGGLDAAGRAPAVAYAAVVYGSLSYTYFHFFNMSETARRIRILYEVGRAGALSIDEMDRLYKNVDIVDTRLKRLIALDQVRRVGDGYQLKRRTLHYAAIAVFAWRRLLGFHGDP